MWSQDRDAAVAECPRTCGIETADKDCEPSNGGTGSRRHSVCEERPASLIDINELLVISESAEETLLRPPAESKEHRRGPIRNVVAPNPSPDPLGATREPEDHAGVILKWPVNQEPAMWCQQGLKTLHHPTGIREVKQDVREVDDVKLHTARQDVFERRYSHASPERRLGDDTFIIFCSLTSDAKSACQPQKVSGAATKVQERLYAAQAAQDFNSSVVVTGRVAGQDVRWFMIRVPLVDLPQLKGTRQRIHDDGAAAAAAAPGIDLTTPPTFVRERRPSKTITAQRTWRVATL